MQTDVVVVGGGPAGFAAAKKGISPRELDIGEQQKALRKANVWLG